MKKFKVRSGKLTVLTMGLLLAISLTLIFSDNDVSIWASESETPLLEAKIYSQVTLDEDFDDSSVLVVMDKHTGGINKRHDESFFGDFPKEAVYDLTYMSGDIASRKYLDRENFRQIIQIKLPDKSKEMVLHTIRDLEKIEGILWAGPNHFELPTAQPVAAGGTRYPNQWGLHGDFGINVEDAWNFTTGATGNNRVRVGIIDTGLNSHPDLNANIVAGGDFLEANMINVANNIPGPLRDDANGHGTRVAGIVGATGNNLNGVAGVAWNVALVPLQVANAANTILDVAAVARAIIWATNDIPVLNYSGGGYSNTVNGFSAREQAIRNYTGLLVCSAGNDGDNVDNTPHFPSEYSDETNNNYNQFSNRVISVSAITENGDRRGTSNYGARTVSLFAPGNDNPTTLRTGGYGVISQTSAAAPHVAGVAALMLSANPSLTSAQIKAAILNNVDVDNRYENDPTLGRLCVTGGRLNAYKAVKSVAYNTNIVNNEVEILSPMFTPSGAITIPSNIGGLPVTKIGASAFINKTGLTSVSVPSSVTHIGNNAFQGCSGLTGITLPADLTHIGDNAFYGCGGLTGAITLPNGLASIGEKAFAYSGITGITLPAGVTQIGSEAFGNCTGLTSFTVPAGVTSIASWMFSGCKNLASVTIHNNVTSIGSAAFYNCSGLISISIPASVTNIGAYAFYGCSGFTSVLFGLGSQLTTIGNYAFQNCNKLTGISIPASVTGIGNYAFSGCSGLTGSLTLPSGVASIGEYAFSGCSGLTGSLTIPSGVASIGEYAFSGCNKLASVVISSGLTAIGSYVFYNCSSLTSVTLPNSVTSIGYGAFSGCRSLTGITIPSSVTSA